MQKKLKISYILNIGIVILTIIGTIFRLTGFQFMNANKIDLVDYISPYCFFTVDSNILMGIMAFVFAVYEYRLFKDKIEYIPKSIYILKFVFTVGVVLTFLTTAFYLAPFSEYGFYPFFANSNLFFHLIIPVLSLVTFCFFENTDKIKYKEICYGLVPMLIYAAFYTINGLTHMKNNKVPKLYDWYGFFKVGNNSIIFVFIIMLTFTYLICLMLWYINKKLVSNKEK